MASIVKRNKRYVVIYDLKPWGGKRKQKWETYHSLEEAQRRKDEIENPIPFLGVASKINTLSELLNEYVLLYGKAQWSFSFHANNISLMKHYIIPFIGDVKLSQINTFLMSRFYDKLRQTPIAANKYTPNKSGILTLGVIFEIHQLLRSVFNQAVIWGFLTDNPVKHISMKKPRNKPIDILTPEQIMTVINKAIYSDPFLALVIQVAFMASLRKGELMALKWEDINFENNSIDVNKELSRVSLESLQFLGNKDIYYIFPPQMKNTKSCLVLKSPKTASSVRVVYIPKSLIDCLLMWKDEQNRQKIKYGDKYKDFGFVFAKENGQPLQGGEISDAFYQILHECGLPKVVFHSLRHTSTTYKLILSEGNIKAVQGDNGHAQPNMVLNVYARILDEERRKIAIKMDAAFCSKLNLNDDE